ncbi:uncharacterized protein LOC132606762 isoform X3 [Lycium barbarum]|uniref:uncharacterized protein LOC132606762 isoform X3 n=1 Tax=Lycium barbarum TaxID=112863 RepID=UPI00293F21DF|nr:uncharacterized protein LOC132606762 isoform X3 [Lycium barbarum]
MMGPGRRTHTFRPSNSAPSSPYQGKNARVFRNLPRDQLGGVIFGCRNTTIRECLETQLFGLPSQHISYVKNVNPGLPLFLFNYSDRKLHGIFEAASSGQMQIDPYAWTSDNPGRTGYPAQVQIRVRLYCQPLLEDQFKPIILDNYYSLHHFLFELDHAQSSKLISKLSSLAFAPSSISHNPAYRRSIVQRLPANDEVADNGSFEPQDWEYKPSSSIDVNRKLGAGDISRWSDDRELQPEAPLHSQAASDAKDFIYMKLKELALARARSGSPTNGHAEESTNAALSNDNDVSIGQTAFLEPQPPEEEKNKEGSCDLSGYPSFITQLVMKELKDFREEQTQKMSGLEQKLGKISSLEQELADAKEEIELLKRRCLMLESTSSSRTHDSEDVVESDDIVNDESIILAGGYDGDSWLSALDLYSPLNDVLKSLQPMNSVRSYFAIANLSGELYVFGGGSGSLWYNTVESYNPANNKWTVHPCLNGKKGNLSGALLKDKIFAIGGGTDIECFSEVEMYDPQVGRWISTQSMSQKRFALAAAELDGALYAVGGYDGSNYLATAERFDPREHAWAKIESMSTKRGSHALVPLRGKLYALGGYDGSQHVPSIEIYDPRLGTWIIGEPMNYPRGYSAAAVLKESIYVIGGVQSDEMLDMIERYKEGEGWQTTNSRAVGKRYELTGRRLRSLGSARTSLLVSPISFGV